MTRPDAVQQLLEQRSDLWRGRRGRAGQALSTGNAALDAALPDGGWPRGRLVDLRVEQAGLGELELLLPMLAERTRQAEPVVLIAPPLVPCPQRLTAAGVDLARLLIVRAPEQAAWAAEQCLKSALCGALVWWPPPRQDDPRTLRRLQLAAESGPAPVFSCLTAERRDASSAHLRLAVRAGGAIEILRSRLGHEGVTLQLAASNVLPFRSAS